MNKKGFTSNELARKVGSSKSTISRYLNKSRQFPVNKVDDYAKVFNVTPEYILGFDEDSFEVDLGTTTHKVTYYGKVSAGNFEGVAIDNRELDVPDIAFNGRNPKECIALQVNGDSMNKILSNGSYIIIHDYRRNQDYRLNNNDILVLRLGGEYTVKRVRRTETKLHLDPVSYSDEFKTNSYDLDSIDGIEVIGKVIYNYQIFD
ncbi:LexA family transcriptional regulator [Staphylococcus hominis]|uniref:LexA family transcriptional regulator n=1 Tax=Staphylococcus hominis TaxID=1290 RepID=UPI001F59C988|nr:XRE family transcriptional regulator [Staphylococcus hominis]MCI2896217.1 XRE family transcriptional regulator [Staphylococcus hominis]MDS3901039.1 XRE family transcriptional regulator [Staphylococcus hominis]